MAISLYRRLFKKPEHKQDLTRTQIYICEYLYMFSYRGAWQLFILFATDRPYGWAVLLIDLTKERAEMVIDVDPPNVEPTPEELEQRHEEDELAGL